MTMLSMSHEDGSHPTGRTKFRVETIRVSHKGIGTDQRNRNSTECGMIWLFENRSSLGCLGQNAGLIDERDLCKAQCV